MKSVRRKPVTFQADVLEHHYILKAPPQHMNCNQTVLQRIKLTERTNLLCWVDSMKDNIVLYLSHRQNERGRQIETLKTKKKCELMMWAWIALMRFKRTFVKRTAADDVAASFSP